ncbi:MAG TPA: type II secretion system protein [Candidatus Paceibacterota bacterium]
MLNLKSKNTKGFTRRGGFTLIELLISLSIFSLVVLVAIGALLNLSHVNDRAQALLVALENLNFALEHMSRPMRTGKNYDCNGGFPVAVPTDCTVIGSSRISFKEGETTYLFYLQDGAIWRRSSSPEGEDGPFKITAPEVTIQEVTFNVTGSAPPPDQSQPRVLMTVRGQTSIFGLKANEQADFNIQTTVSQREADANI